jgi:hypothetical protein
MDRENRHVTYVYCLVAAERRPSLRGIPAGLPGTGSVRLIDLPAPDAPRSKGVRLRRWLVAADAPARQFDETTINARLGDLSWVSRAAVAHEAVVEKFTRSAALLPMKLFTLFHSDDRAVDHIVGRGAELDEILERVMHHEEWGIRLVLDRARATGAVPPPPRTNARLGTRYLAGKRAQREAVAHLASDAREASADLFERLSAMASSARRRPAADLPPPGAPLLLDAAFLVPRRRVRAFRAAAVRQARAFEGRGYRLTMTGPWPPYSFM